MAGNVNTKEDPMCGQLGSLLVALRELVARGPSPGAPAQRIERWISASGQATPPDQPALIDPFPDRAIESEPMPRVISRLDLPEAARFSAAPEVWFEAFGLAAAAFAREVPVAQHDADRAEPDPVALGERDVAAWRTARSRSRTKRPADATEAPHHAVGATVAHPGSRAECHAHR
jgi:hypothetical protein